MEPKIVSFVRSALKVRKYVKFAESQEINIDDPEIIKTLWAFAIGGMMKDKEVEDFIIFWNMRKVGA